MANDRLLNILEVCNILGVSRSSFDRIRRGQAIITNGDGIHMKFPEPSLVIEGIPKWTASCITTWINSGKKTIAATTVDVAYIAATYDKRCSVIIGLLVADYTSANKGVKVSAFADKLSVSAETVRTTLNLLITKGDVYSTGAGRATRYLLVDETASRIGCQKAKHQ